MACWNIAVKDLPHNKCSNCHSSESQMYSCSNKHLYCQRCFENTNPFVGPTLGASANCCPRCNEVTKFQPIEGSFSSLNPYFTDGFYCTQCSEVTPIAGWCLNCHTNGASGNVYSPRHHDHSICVNSYSPHHDFSGRKTKSPSLSLSPATRNNQELWKGRRNAEFCYTHKIRSDIFCKNCRQIYCSRCVGENHTTHSCINVNEAVSEFKASRSKLMYLFNNFVTTLQEKFDTLTSTEGEIHQNTNVAISNIEETANTLMRLVADERASLIQDVKSIAEEKRRINNVQKQRVKQMLDNVLNVIENFKLLLALGSDIDILLAPDRFIRQYHIFENASDLHVPHENADITVTIPSQKSLYLMARFGHISTYAFGPYSYIQTEIIDTVPMNSGTSFIVQACNHVRQPMTNGGDQLDVKIIGPDSSIVTATVTDQGNGTYTVFYCPQTNGLHRVFVSFYQKDIIDSPFNVEVVVPRNFMLPPRMDAFGSTGDGDNQFCRPWGICIGYRNRIIVGDRSNNRVKIHDSNGNFIKCIPPVRLERNIFDRPTGVACDMYGRIVISDKDNHCIQVFDPEGSFLFKFGEKGSGVGQFAYPWDVACNSKCQIIVADTRNHRLQLFDSNGNYIDKYGFEGNLWKQFDTPRGVAFTPDGNIVATDFNNHRVVYIEKDLSTSHFIGCEGTRDGQFQRPQGIVVDPMGNIIVADGKNYRIQVFDKNGQFLRKYGGVNGASIGQMGCPSGICYTHDQRILVVDYGNDRVHLF